MPVKAQKRRRTKVKIGVGADGKDLYKWAQGYTKKELEESKKRIIEYYIDGTGLEADHAFGEYAVKWYHERKEPFISPSGQANYRTALNKYILPVFGDRRLRSIRSSDLQIFLNDFSGMSKSYITLIMTTLQNIFAQAKADRIIQFDPAENLIRPQATPPEEKRALTEQERERIKALFDTHPHGLYIAVMYYTGMRPGEVRGLKWGDFDWNEGIIHVQRDVDYKTKSASLGTLKTQSSDRFVPIADELRHLMYQQRGLDSMLVFPGRHGSPIAQSTATRMWIELMKEAGFVEPVENGITKYGNDIRGEWKPTITPHMMRHNFITMCWEAGFDIMLTQKLVGHSDYKTTANIYTHLSKRHLIDATDKLNDMFEKKSCQKVAKRTIR